MRNGLRGLWGQTTFRLCLVLWCFGYILVDIGAHLQGRSGLGIMLLSNLPLLALGVAQSMLLAGLLNRLAEGRALIRWPLMFIAIVFAGTLQTLFDFLWLRTLALSVFPDWQKWALNTDASRVFMIHLLYTWTMALSVALIWSARATDIAKLNDARAAAFEAAASRAEAAALRLQLNPHFLFNTLNGIASLVVRRKSSQAEDMIGRLADFLRSSLSADPTALIPLSQELSTVRSYLHIEKARFGDRMRVSYDIAEDALDKAVPNFLMQPLIENAVKHGVGSSRQGAIIEIAAAVEGPMLMLRVQNREIGVKAGSGPVPPGDIACSGLGLANTRRRLHSLYGEGAWLRVEAIGRLFRAEIGLPASPAAANADGLKAAAE